MEPRSEARRKLKPRGIVNYTTSRRPAIYAYAPRDVEIIDPPLTDATNEATGESGEGAPHSHTALFNKLGQGHTAARSVVANGASRQAPHSQSEGNFEPLLDVIEAARLLRIHPKTLRVKARRGIIPAVQIESGDFGSPH